MTKANDAGTASDEISIDMAGDLPRLQIATIAYPDLTVLDLVGPQVARGAVDQLSDLALLRTAR